MKVVTQAGVIRNELARIRPARVAVAYVGSDWANFVSLPHLREVVLSPTFGSNPKAIAEIMQKLGEENVHFLDKLHSKFYLGQDAALLGSCNLTSNGLSDQGLFESAVVLTDDKVRKQLDTEYERYKDLARKQYPTSDMKWERLRELESQWGRAERSGLVPPTKSGAPSIVSCQSKLYRIHVCWCGSQPMKHNKKRTEKAAREAAAGSFAEYMSDEMAFHKSDDIRPRDWILRWSCNGQGLPRANGRIGWLYVHKVIKGGFDDPEYPTLALQAKPQFERRPTEPFLLDKRMQSLVREVLNSRKFPALLALDDEKPWRLRSADKVTHQFLEALRNGAERMAKR